ncbi:hypothetical protein CN404_30675, partial [Bacillus thuringiensis]|uniref:hypothetical protein n=1 Tax=Bacillus thuringiensis TaxID=1428 RepID=UPI000BFACBF6
LKKKPMRWDYINGVQIPGLYVPITNRGILLNGGFAYFNDIMNHLKDAYYFNLQHSVRSFHIFYFL